MKRSYALVLKDIRKVATRMKLLQREADKLDRLYTSLHDEAQNLQVLEKQNKKLAITKSDSSRDALIKRISRVVIEADLSYTRKYKSNVRLKFWRCSKPKKSTIAELRSIPGVSNVEWKPAALGYNAPWSLYVFF